MSPVVLFPVAAQILENYLVVIRPKIKNSWCTSSTPAGATRGAKNETLGSCASIKPEIKTCWEHPTRGTLGGGGVRPNPPSTPPPPLFQYTPCRHGGWHNKTVRTQRSCVSKLQGLSLTAQTGRILRLKPTKFRLLAEVSLDSVRLPDMPEGFQAELLQQAQELHCGHASLPMDPSWLVVPADPSNPADDPYFVSCQRGAMPWPPGPLVAGAPPSFHDLVQAMGKGSQAMSLEELQHPLVGALPGYTLLVLAQLLHALSEGVPSRLLTAVPHLCMAKNQPVWLFCNS